MVSVMALSLFSCEKEKYVEITYDKICQASDFYIQGSSIYPIFEYDQCVDIKSRNFYESVDTSLFFKVKQLPFAKESRMYLSAIDWRITDISVVTLDNFDEDHPAGSSLDDVLKVSFFYHNKYIEIPLTEIEYGSLMLSDFHTYPEYNGDPPELNLVYPDDCWVRPAIEVTIEDAFGRCMIARIVKK